MSPSVTRMLVVMKSTSTTEQEGRYVEGSMVKGNVVRGYSEGECGEG